MIELINRRYVPFFFNRGGPGQGKDEAALRFVGGQTTNQYAYLAAFRPTGEMLGETELYADKDAVAEFLIELLRKHPEYAGETEAEREALREGGLVARARRTEAVGDYADAESLWTGLLDEKDPRILEEARLGLLRITRYAKRWSEHKAHAAALLALGRPGLEVHHGVELGYGLLAFKNYGAARALLQPLASRTSDHPRLAEAHFYAGVACWFQGDRDWAKFHWVWILENLPEDRLFSRARVAAAAEAMPYANPELGGFRADVGNIGTGHIVAGVQAATEVYGRLRASFEQGDFHAALADTRTPVEERPAPKTSAALGSASPLMLVAALRDGNDSVEANNRIVDRLEALGERSIPVLVAAVGDEAFPGRGYAAWALASVMKAAGTQPEAGMEALQRALRSGDAYVEALARSGLSVLER